MTGNEEIQMPPWMRTKNENWPIRKVAHGFGSIGSGTTPPSGDAHWYEDGTIPWVTTSELRETVVSHTKKCVTEKALKTFSALRVHKPGSLAVAMYGATIGRLGILGLSATTNQACCVLSGEVSLNAKFTFYWLWAFREHVIGWYATGGGQPNINQDAVSSIRFAVPSIKKQSAIALALDRETARIDALIEKKTRFIELLKEKRQALITQAVTKGLDPNVSMKDSGVEWIGEVPAHWEARKIKTLFRLNCKKSGKDHGEQLLSVYTEIGVRPRAELEERGNKASTTDDYLIVRRGDLVVNIILAWMGAIGHSAYDGVTSPAYDILTPGTSTFSPFYHFYLRRPEASTEIKRWSKGIMDMRLRIYFEQLGQIFVPHPPLQEQKDIVAFVESEGVRIGRLVDMTTRSIELLKERRSALITAAVTGQIDLREEVA